MSHTRLARRRSFSYQGLVQSLSELLVDARRLTARSVNSVLTATYWEIGRRIVRFEQSGRRRAAYGEELLERLSMDLAGRFGRGFSRRNLSFMREFYLEHKPGAIWQTVSAKSQFASKPASSTRHKCPTQGAVSSGTFQLPWSHYCRLLQVRDRKARGFYEDESLRGGWSVRQLDRQIQSQFYERTVLSKNRAALLGNSRTTRVDELSPEEEIKDPFILEFLDLKDEYSESDLEEALIRHLETFLLELGGDFAFVARQKRLRVGNEWYRVDLVCFHRGLRCLVLFDLKLGKFTHADAGQMHLYLNYAREHWTRLHENPPVGLILCAEKDEAVAKYALEGLPTAVLAAEYRTALPKEAVFEREVARTRRSLESRIASGRSLRISR